MGFGGGVGSFLIFGSYIFEETFLQKKIGDMCHVLNPEEDGVRRPV